MLSFAHLDTFSRHFKVNKSMNMYAFDGCTSNVLSVLSVRIFDRFSQYFYAVMNRIKPVVVALAVFQSVAVSAGFGGPAVGFMCFLWPQVVLRRVGDEGRTRCISPG